MDSSQLWVIVKPQMCEPTKSTAQNNSSDGIVQCAACVHQHHEITVEGMWDNLDQH